MDIVLLILDTARGDITNSLIENGELPNLAALAKNGQWYTDARANGPWTVPSHGSIFTGTYPSESGITGGDPTYHSVPLVEELRAKGYTTAGFSANPWLSSEFGFDSAFDDFYNKHDYYSEGMSVSKLFGENHSPRRLSKILFTELQKNPVTPSLVNLSYWAKQCLVRKDSGGKYLLSRAAERLTEDPERNDFLFVNVTEPHLAYELPDEWLPEGVTSSELEDIEQDPARYNANISDISESEFEILRRAYKSALKYIDYRIGKLLEEVDGETTVIVAGDHGEHLGERGRFGHQYSLRRELLHVPLVIHGPKIDAEEITETVELKSLYGFILDVADGKDGRLPELDYHIAETVSPRPSVRTLEQKKSANPAEYTYKYGEGARSIVSDGVKLVEFPNEDTELLTEGGVNNASQEIRQSLHSELVAECGKMKFENQDELEVSEEIQSQLEDLGYA